MRAYGWITLLFAVFATTGAWSEELTLTQAMQLAREQYASVKAAKAKAEAAHQRLQQARGYRLPAVAFQEIFIRTNAPAEAFALKLNQERFSFGSFMTTDPNDPARLTTGISRFELQLPLFTGGELGSRIGQAQAAEEASKLSYRWEQEQAALAAAEAFVMLAQAREYVRLLEKARETVAAHVAMARAYVDQGMLVESEYLRAEVELARIDDLLAQARGQEKVAQANLAFRLGLDQDRQFELPLLPEPQPPRNGLDFYLASSAARPDLKAAQALVKAAELEVKVKKAAFFPRVGLIARADWFDDKIFGTHGDSTTVMAAANMNLFAGGANRAAVAAAQADARAGHEQVALFAQGIQLEVRQAFTEAQVALARAETAKKALRAAAETERVVSERFRQGVVKMIDVLDAATARREAETRELVARSEAHRALLQLAVKAGLQPETVLP